MKDDKILEFLANGILEVNFDTGEVLVNGTLRPTYLCPNGYPRVIFKYKGTEYKLRVNRIVMLAHLGEIPEGYFVSFIGDRTDTRLCNLKLDTRSGLNKKRKHYTTRPKTLTNEELEEARQLSSDTSIGALSRMFSVSHTMMKKRLTVDYVNVRKGKGYSFISPEGDIYTGSNIKSFARQHSLRYSELLRLRRGLISSVHGWKNGELQ